MRSLVLLIMFAACGSSTSTVPRPVADSCSTADEARQLANAGRIERAAQLLGDPTRCPHPPADVLALLAQLRADLLSSDDPDALIESAFAARARGDEVSANRQLARALASAEASGARAQPVPWLRTSVNRYYSYHPLWSPQGRHVVLPEWNTSGDGIRPRRATILDVESLRAIRVDLHDAAELSPDGRFLMLEAMPRRVGADPRDEIRVLSVDTGAEVMPRRRAVPGAPVQFGPDSRLTWLERDGGDYVVRLVALGSGPPTETLRGPLRGRESAALVLGPTELVVDIDTELHVWRASKHVATVPGDLGAHAAIEAHRLVHVLDDRLVFVDLAAAQPATVHLPDSRGPCHDARVADGSAPRRCSADRYVVDSGGHACLWDLANRRLVRAIPAPALREAGPIFTCTNDRIEIGKPEVGSTIEVFSATTGARVGAYPFDDGSIDTTATGDRLVERAGLRVISRSGAQVDLEDSRDVGKAQLSPDAVLVVGVGPRDVRERFGEPSPRARSSLWDARTGKLLWRSPLAPQAAAVAFDVQTGELVVASDETARWRLDLRTQRLRASPPLRTCTTTAVSASDGRSTIACTTPSTSSDPRALDPVRLHREGKPIQDLGAGTVALAGSSLASYDQDASAVRVSPDLDAARAWSVEVRTSHGIVMGVAERGDLVAVADGSWLELHRRGQVIWRISQPPAQVGRALWMGPGMIASCDSGLHVWGTGGKKLADIESEHGCVAAFGAPGKRIAYSVLGGIEIYDLAKRTTMSLGKIEIAGEIEAIAWSPDGTQIAAVADRTVFLWEVAENASPTRIYVAGSAAVAVAADHTVRLFGDAEEARGLMACQIGGRLYPYALCRDRFEP